MLDVSKLVVQQRLCDKYKKNLKSRQLTKKDFCNDEA